MPESNDWYYATSNQPVGPVSLAQLQANARAGTLKPTDRVWRSPMPNWVQAGSLMEIFAPNPTPAPSAMPPPVPQTMPYAAPPPPANSPDVGQDAGMRLLIPVGRSGWAIAAGYLGLISVLPIFAPFAIFAAIMAFRDMKRDPSRHGMGRAIFGLIMGIIFSLVLLLLVGLVVVNNL